MVNFTEAFEDLEWEDLSDQNPNDIIEINILNSQEPSANVNLVNESSDSSIESEPDNDES